MKTKLHIHKTSYSYRRITHKPLVTLVANKAHLAPFLKWWRQQQRRYGYAWRAANLGVALLLLLTIAIPVLQNTQQQSRYKLSADTLHLVGNTDTSLSKQLDFDAKTQTYQFNANALKTSDTNPLTSLNTQVGTAKGGKDKSLYALDVAQNLSDGVTYHDINSQLSFSLTPEFSAATGRSIDGHLVYPLASDAQAIYTLKNNGLKEDIVVQKATSDSLSYSYKLNLPKTLEAKVIPNDNGAIGIYSADPALFDNISYGSSSDQAAVEKARENSPKTNLVFGLPSPVIKTATGPTSGNTSARFVLSGDQLTVVATGLSSIAGPFTIDPSVVVTSTSDFQTGGNSDSNIDFSTSGQVTRGGLSGGTLSGGWATTSSFTNVRQGARSVAYNGYLYLVGGGNGVIYNDVQYAPINSDGTIGSWASTSAMATYHAYFGLEAYNGYMYAYGGTNTGGGVITNSTEYAKINSNGTLGTWTTTTNMANTRTSFGTAVYQGYLYAMGGYDGSAVNNDVQYAPINADGTVGSWTTTTSFTTARSSLSGVVYNGYMYIMGGYNAASTYYNDVQYATINSDGTVGTWTTTSSFTTARASSAVSASNGYMYLMGGTPDLSSSLGDTQYAQINANGTLSAWQTTTTLNTSVWNAATTAYNGYVYVLGGYNGTTADSNLTQYAKIDPAGMISGYSSTTSLTTPAITSGGCVAYNGYLYMIGGYTGSTYTTAVKYAPINADGTLGSWTTATNSLGTGVGLAGAAVYNGYLYVVGGYTGSTDIQTVQYSQIGSSGAPGAWSTTTNYPDSNGTHGHQTIAYNGYLYGFGSGGGSTNTVYYAPINTNGTVGSWTAGNTLANPRVYENATAYDGYMYVIGGNNSGSTASLTSVEYAPISATGALGSWSSTSNLLTARSRFVLGVINGYVYAQGGTDVSTSGTYATTEYARINSNGTLGSWAYSTNLLGGQTYQSQGTAYNGMLYVISGNVAGSRSTASYYGTVNNGGNGTVGSWASGGLLACGTYAFGTAQYNGHVYTAGGTCGITNNDIQYAGFNTDGTIGSFTTDSHAFTTAREEDAAVAYNGYLYVIGGTNLGFTTHYGDVQYAPIGSSGALSGNFTTNTSSGSTFTTGVSGDTGRFGTCSLAYNGYMYIMGGYDGTSDHNDIRYAAINSNGSLGSWADSGHNFTNARSEAGCFTAGGYIYIVGGNGTADYNDVQAAQINSNGSLGAWKTTASFATPRMNAQVVTYDGYAYIIGGCTDTTSICSTSTALQDVQVAAVGPNGTVGPWATTTNIPLKKGNGGAIAYKGYLYTIGGNEPSGSGNDTYSAPISTIARSGTYSKLIDLGASANVTSLSYNGNLPGGLRSISVKAADATGVFGSAITADTLSGTGCSSGTTVNKRYLLVTIRLSDNGGTAGGTFADASSGNIANVTDFTVNYTLSHPLPSVRLRTGQTLTSGNLSALDTCYP